MLLIKQADACDSVLFTGIIKKQRIGLENTGIALTCVKP